MPGRTRPPRDPPAAAGRDRAVAVRRRGRGGLLRVRGGATSMPLRAAPSRARSEPSASTTRSERATTSSVAPLTLTNSWPSSSCTTDISRSAGSKSASRARSRGRREHPAPSRPRPPGGRAPSGRRSLGVLAELCVVASRRRAPQLTRATSRSIAERNSPSPVRSTDPRAVERAMTCIRFSVSVPVLSEQITVVEPSVSIAEPLHERSSAGELPYADRERQRDRRQEALGDVRDDETDREAGGVREREPGDEPEGQEGEADGHGDEAISHATRRTSRSRGSPHGRPAARARRSGRAGSPCRWRIRRPARRLPSPSCR